MCFWAFLLHAAFKWHLLAGPFSPKHCQGRSFPLSFPHFWQVWNEAPGVNILEIPLSLSLPYIKSSFLLNTQKNVPSRSINEYNASHLYPGFLGRTQKSTLLSPLLKAISPVHQQIQKFESRFVFLLSLIYHILVFKFLASTSHK